jgi:hypothetical protein
MMEEEVQEMIVYPEMRASTKADLESAKKQLSLDSSEVLTFDNVSPIALTPTSVPQNIDTDF